MTFALYVLNPSQWQEYVLKDLRPHNGLNEDTQARLSSYPVASIDLWLLMSDGTSRLEEYSEAKMLSFLAGIHNSLNAYAQ